MTGVAPDAVFVGSCWDAPADGLADFLRCWHRSAGRKEAFDATATVIRSEIARGTDQAAVHRMYYATLAGSSRVAVLEAARDWARLRPAAAEPGGGALRDARARHRAAGATVVLVSGSFRACLAAQVELTGAGSVLCAEPAADGTT